MTKSKVFWIYLIVAILFRLSQLQADLDDFANPGASLSNSDVSFIGDNVDEQSGFSTASAGDVDGDGLADILIGAPWYDSVSGTIYVGQAYLILGSSIASGSVSLSGADCTFTGEGSYDYAGTSVAGAGDVDGDGLADILVGLGEEYAPGKAYLILGSTLSSASGNISLSTADFIFEAWGEFGCGRSVSSAGDIDGDGLGDILIGAPGFPGFFYPPTVPNPGAVYLILGSTILASSGGMSVSDADFIFNGESDGTGTGAAPWTGGSLSGKGDVDGDGINDILIGASGRDSGGLDAGKTYLVLGSSVLASSGTIDLLNADCAFIGEDQGDRSGSNVSFAGDVDGDGLDDVLIGAYRNDDAGSDAGKVYLILGSSIMASSGTIDLSNADYTFPGECSGDYASKVSGLRDIDGDGLDEILIGAYGNDDAGSNAGKVYLILGSSIMASSGIIDLWDADRIFMGENTGDHAGVSVASAGDVDGNGREDILIGAYTNDDAGTDTGKTYLVFDECINHVTNPSADDGLTGWTTYGLVSVSTVGGDSHFLLRSDWAYMYQDIDIPSGSSFVHIEAQVKTLRNAKTPITANEGFPYLYAYVMNGGNTILQYLNTTPSTSTSWITVQINTSLSSAAVKLRLFLRRSNHTAYTDYNRAYFDDVTVNFDCD